MRVFLLVAVVACAIVCDASTASADVQLSIQNGRVTLVAKDATIRQILTEWARVGQTKIVNVERIPGGPVTLELRDVSEQQALRVLLRSLGGYVTAPRATQIADASVFDRILVMPVTAPAPAPVSASAAPAPPPFTAFQPPQFQQPPQDDDRDDVVAPPQTPGNRGPVFVFPPAGGGNQPQQPPPINQPGTAGRPASNPFPGTSATPGAPATTAPVGVSVPGMMVPAPQPPPAAPGTVQPGQPGQPGLPALQPRDRSF